MRHENRLRPVFAQVLDGRETFANASVIGNGDFAIAVFGGNIEIDADQDAPPAHLEIAEGEFIHGFPPS
jgi:hypothetical protein